VPRTDVVIPARNEAENIPQVLSVIGRYPDTGTIIVSVDPATTDDTREVATECAKRFFSGVKLMVIDAKESGKGQCAEAGLCFVASNRVVFCDADIKGLTWKHLDKLFSPRLPYRNGMIIAVPEIPPNYWISVATLNAWPWVSGQRSLPMRALTGLNLHGYLMETQINAAVRKHRMTTDLVLCPGMISPFCMTPERLLAMESDRRWGMEHGLLSPP